MHADVSGGTALGGGSRDEAEAVEAMGGMAPVMWVRPGI